MSSEAIDVLAFWFGVPGEADYGAQRTLWFRKSEATDREIAGRFGALIDRALGGELSAWAGQADTALAQVLFTTSTRDDRVHPGHARKMAAKMLAQGHPLLYYANIEGGHGGAADNEQRAHLMALEFSYLWRQLGR